MKVRSLRTQTLLVLGATIALCWVVALAVVCWQLSRNTASLWDENLETMAKHILLTVPAGKDLKPGGQQGLRLRSDIPTKRGHLVFQVWGPGQQLIVRAPEAPRSPLRPDFQEGAVTTVIDGERWRAYSLSDATGRVIVQVGSLHSVVDAELQHEALFALGVSTVLLLIVAVLMAGVLRRSLEPVQALGVALRQRPGFDLTPLATTDLPIEIRPLVESFNHVLRQLDTAVEGERRFIGDAAHELRTPLSALQAQAQIALRATSLADKDVALTKLLAVVERSTRLSEQLLDLARLNAGANAPQFARVDLGTLVVHVTQEFDAAAQQRGRSIVLDIAPCTIRCDVDEIGILLRNLIDNALRYTHAGGRLRVRCGPAGPAAGEGAVWLEVADNGPGVPEAEHEAIFKRFHRVAGSAARGSGIGLSLVAGIAKQHGATIEITPGLDGRGIGMRVSFPAA